MPRRWLPPVTEMLVRFTSNSTRAGEAKGMGCASAVSTETGVPLGMGAPPGTSRAGVKVTVWVEPVVFEVTVRLPLVAPLTRIVSPALMGTPFGTVMVTLVAPSETEPVVSARPAP